MGYLFSTLRRIVCLFAIAGLVGAVAGAPARGRGQELKAAFKRFTFKNVAGNAITQTDITLDQTPGVIKGGQGLGGSDTFKNSKVTGKTLTLTGGSLAVGASDAFDMNLSPLMKGPYVIQQVVLTDANGTQTTLNLGTKVFKDNVAGFTLDEFYDLTNPAIGLLHIGNGSPGLDIEYTLTNLRVFTNLSLATFDIDNYTSPAATATPVIVRSSWTITPGGANDLDLLLGPIIADRYELAAVDSLIVRDLETGATFVTQPLFLPRRQRSRGRAASPCSRWARSACSGCAGGSARPAGGPARAWKRDPKGGPDSVCFVRSRTRRTLDIPATEIGAVSVKACRVMAD